MEPAAQDEHIHTVSSEAPDGFEEQAGTRRRSVRSAVLAFLADAAVIVPAMAIVGAAAGGVWSLLVTPPAQVRFEDGIGQDEVALSQVFPVDGWFVVCALVAAILAALLLGGLRKRDPLATLLLVVAGSVLAAYVMREVGPLLGPDDPAALLESAPVGTRADAPWELSSDVALLAWPVAALTGMLIILLSRADEPRR